MRRLFDDSGEAAAAAEAQRRRAAAADEADGGVGLWRRTGVPSTATKANHGSEEREIHQCFVSVFMARVCFARLCTIPTLREFEPPYLRRLTRHYPTLHSTLTMAAFRVPILPHTSPPAPQPPSIALTLHPHQLRALHRCLLIENDGNLAKDFGAQHDYRSRGGCLADAVGMGKTVSFPFPFFLLHRFETFRRVSMGAICVVISFSSSITDRFSKCLNRHYL